MDYTLKDLLIFLGIALFIILMLWDISVSLWKGALWFPGEALILTGLTIQILGYIETQNNNASGIKSLLESQLSIDCARLTMCVFVGFLLPRMAAPTAGTRWSNILALLISISTHISTEVYVIHNAKNARSLKEEKVSWFLGSGGVLLLSITALVVLLSYVVIAGKFISENLSRRIKHSLLNNKLEIEDDENKFEYKILQTWWAARVCQPEYVISRSVFSAATGGIVTCCVVLFGVKVILLRSLVNRVPLFSLQCVFILIGWAFIFYRWWTAVLYFRGLSKSWNNSRRVFLAGISRYLQLQKYLFGFIAYDLMGMKNSALWHGFKAHKSYRMIKVYLKSLFIVIKVFISLLLIVPWFAFHFTTAIATILMSMFFWGFLALLCRLQCWQTAEPDEELNKYEGALKSVVIYAEEPASLLTANRRSFQNIKSTMTKAFATGKHCKELINLVGHYSVENFVDKLKQFADGKNETSETKKMLLDFPGVNERSWRMTALSLVKMMLEVGDSVSPEDKQSNDIVQEGVVAFKQARDLMDFADCADNVHVNAESFNTSNMEAFLLRYQAEKDFRSLKRMYRHWKLGRELNRVDDSVVEALDRCSPKLFECSACVTNMFKKSLYSRNLAKNSNEPTCKSIYFASLQHFERLQKHVNVGRTACWEDVAPTYYLLLVSQFIKEKVFEEQKIEDPPQLLSILRSYLADVVYESLKNLPEQILESCNKWAADFEEEKISKAIDIAGRAWAVKDKVRNPGKESNDGAKHLEKESTAVASATVQHYPGGIVSIV